MLLVMKQHFHITSYRLAFWHASERARHEEGGDLDCVFCQYSEGVARIHDVIGYLQRQGFTISEFDDRSFTITLDDSPNSSGTLYSKGKNDLIQSISGKQNFFLHSSILA